jgi:hypothetical protein
MRDRDRFANLPNPRPQRFGPAVLDVAPGSSHKLQRGNQPGLALQLELLREPKPSGVPITRQSLEITNF